MRSADLIEQLLTRTGGAKSSLFAMECVDRWQGHPHRTFRSIHIAGTNGKGSVARKVAASLQNGGYSVGLYTSPHLFLFHERIAVNKQLISDHAIEELLPPLVQWIQQEMLQMNFFEITTAMAFQYFADQAIDLAVVETGLGGRLDATNILQPIVTVITSIGYDHTHILGSTLEEIAREKGGIAKSGVPLILGPSIGQDALLSWPTAVRVESQHAFFDEENRAIARAVLCELQRSMYIPQEAIERGLCERPDCRFELGQCKGVDVVFDVAHNPPAFDKLKGALQLHFPRRSYRFVVGISQDKEVGAIVFGLSSYASWIHCVDLDHPRLASAVDLAFFCQGRGAAESSFEQGLLKALDLAQKQKEVLIISGSFFIMATAKKILERENI